MAKPLLLLTNDDGYESPFFIPFKEALASSLDGYSVCSVAPSSEQSWIAQAMSRHSPVFVRERSPSCFVVTGTPADCVDLGLHSLLSTTPSLVVSGINIGTNAGLGFYLNSGTIGAARQAFLSGVPAVAVSQRVPPGVFEAWAKHDSHALDTYSPLFSAACRRSASLVAQLFQTESWEGVDVFSINLPWEIDDRTPSVITKLARTQYGPLFQRRDERSFVHKPLSLPHYRPGSASDDLPDDWEVVGRGKISITPIQYDLRPRGSSIVNRLQESFEGSS